MGDVSASCGENSKLRSVNIGGWYSGEKERPMNTQGREENGDV